MSKLFKNIFWSCWVNVKLQTSVLQTIQDTQRTWETQSYSRQANNEWLWFSHSQFVDTEAKHLVKDIPSYIQDTPDLLRHLKTLKNVKLPKATFPVSIDVVGLYNNIPNEEGLECLLKALNTRLGHRFSSQAQKPHFVSQH